MRQLIQTTLILFLSITITACGGGKKHSGESGSSSSITSSSELSSSSSSLSSEVISSSGSSSLAPDEITDTQGDGQIALPGATLDISPSVVVLSHVNRWTPVPGAKVTFEVVEGGGSIEKSVAFTNSVGGASAGKWTLGPQSGVNKLAVHVEGLPTLFFTAEASILSFTACNADSIFRENIQFTALLRSANQLASVTASINGHTVPLAYDGFWGGAFDGTNLPYGYLDVTFTAIDVFGNSAVQLRRVYHEMPLPVLSLTAPLPDVVALANPEVKIAATCEVNHSCNTFNFSILWGLLDVWDWKTESFRPQADYGSVSSDHISELIDFSKYEKSLNASSCFPLSIWATDSNNQQTARLNKCIALDVNQHMAGYALVNSSVWDVSGNKVLFLDASGAAPALKLYDKTSDTTQLVEASDSITKNGFGFLTSTGAIYIAGKSVVHEWRDGIVSELCEMGPCSNSPDSFKVAGKWAIYDDQLSTPKGLWQRDLDTGVSTFVTSNADSKATSLAPNGDIVAAYRDDSTVDILNMNRFSGGSIVPLPGRAWFPVADSVNTIYFKDNKIFFYDGSQETILSQTNPMFKTDVTYYAAAGGYIAYTEVDSSMNIQVWRYGPEGKQQITNFDNSESFNGIDAIAPNGTILFTYGAKRYASTSGSTFQEVGRVLGRVILRDGKFFEIVGGTVLEIVP